MTDEHIGIDDVETARVELALLLAKENNRWPYSEEAEKARARAVELAQAWFDAEFAAGTI